MNLPSQDETVQALADVVRAALEDGRSIEVTGLGTFEPAHRAASLERTAEGRLEIRPPQTVASFSPAPDLRSSTS